MEEAIQQLGGKDTKERMAGVEQLQHLLEQSRKGLSAQEVATLVDTSLSLLRDNNFRVCQGTLQALASAAALAGEHLKLHFNALLPAVVERLGDGKQPVRDAARRLLLALMEISSPTIVVDRAGSYAWPHKSWRVREEFARTVASAINLFAATELPFQRLLLPSVVQLLEDSNSSAREAAILCLEEMYRQGGSHFREELQQHHLRPTQLREIISRFERIEPRIRPLDISSSQSVTTDLKGGSISVLGTNRRASPKNKCSASASSTGGDSDGLEKPVDPVKISSEKELVREIEKVVSMLTPERDWSARIAAMQKVEGLIYGGATDYTCFPSLLKQLVGPLTQQLSDRRSSIVKQVCHLLSLLSKEMLSDFEPYVESFLPVLFKLVIITVLVIAESADSCIKTMLRNCRVPRVLPRIVHNAKHDRSALLRARCCEYAQLILEQWPDAPEVQRSAELYEDLLKCCTADAMSEVRSSARQIYRLFTRSWPERSRRLFLLFDPTVQRVITEEEGNLQKRYTSPAFRERGLVSLRPAVSGLPSASGGSASLTGEQAAPPSSEQLPPGQALPIQRAVSSHTSDRSLESVLSASQQQVQAIETLLRGMDASEKEASLISSHVDSRDLGGGSYRRIHAAVTAMKGAVDPPSARDPPHPASAPALLQGVTNVPVGQAPSSYTQGILNAGNSSSGSLSASQTTLTLNSGKGYSYSGGLSRDGLSGLGAAKRIPMCSDAVSQGSLISECSEGRVAKRFPKGEYQLERPGASQPLGSLPGFQRPLMRSTVSGRTGGSGRNTADETQLLASSTSSAESFSYMDGLMSLSDALCEGLSAGSDWSARVAAFSYLRKLLQQGPKGGQEVTQCFDKVMRLFSDHLDDPHHKVAQAALSTLLELVPVCRKPFEAYLERIIPHVFARLVDPKEVIRQLGTSALEIIGNTYSIDSLLPALLRSLDEQRSPKAKIAVIEFAIASFAKLALNGEAAGGSGLLKLWLGKLAPLANDKNPRLKETAVTGIISVYSHFDSTTVLNFILGLSIEEQSVLRRSLKQYTPRIEVDLMTYVQNRSQRTRPKSFTDSFDMLSAVNDEGVGKGLGGLLKNQPLPLPGDCDNLSPRKAEVEMNWMNPNRSMLRGYQGQSEQRTSTVLRRQPDKTGSSASGLFDFKIAEGQQTPLSCTTDEENKTVAASTCIEYSDPNVGELLQKARNWLTADKAEILQSILQLARSNEASVLGQYFDQFFPVILGALEEPGPTVRELALSVTAEMLTHVGEGVEEVVEILLEKLLDAIKDPVLKVASAAERCLHGVLTHLDPYRCLKVLVPLLVSEEEKTLVTCISCLTKLVTRFPSEELMSQLPSFLPALFDAFGNQNADVRKTVVFCLVDIYIVLGKAFVPYLGSLSSTQLRLVTIYANRISQARTGNTLDPPR